MKKIVFIVFIITILLSDIFLIEPNMLLVKHKTLDLPNWNSDINNFKIAVISDLHIGTHFVGVNKLKKIVKITNKNKPDLVVILGDFDAVSIKSSKINEDEISKILSEFNAQTIAILGNHDYEPKGVVKKILNNANIPILENSEKFIKYNNKTIRIVGFKDLWHFYLKPNEIIKPNPTPTIVLAHNPDSFPEISNNVSLTLSGHTHGGEIVLPIIGSPFVPSKYGQKYRKGYIVEDNKHLYVSGGVATLSRTRFLNPPEISVLTLNKQDKITKDTAPLKGINKNYAPQLMEKLKQNN